MTRFVLLSLLMFGGLAAADEAAPAIPAPSRCVTVRPLASVDPVRVQADGEHGFSRAPRAPYVTEGGVLVLEYLVPPKCKGGTRTFIQELVFVNADGRSMLMTSYRLSSAAPEGSVLSIDGRWDKIRRYETDSPFVFRQGNRVLRFTMGGKDGCTIESCERFTLGADGKLTPLPALCPATGWKAVQAPMSGALWGE